MSSGVAGMARQPRICAYVGGALLYGTAAAMSSQWPMWIAAGYLLLSPPLWNAWSRRRQCGLGACELALTAFVTLACAPTLIVAVNVWLGLGMGAISLAGARALPTLLPALALGSLGGLLIGGVPPTSDPPIDALALLWLTAFCAAVAFLGHRQTVRMDAARQGERAKSAALADVARRLSKYLSPQLHRQLFELGDSERTPAHRRWLTVFFSDIEGFTAASEHLDAEETARLLNDYLDAMASIAIAHGGTVDKFIGDGMLVFFGDPLPAGREEDACACVRMALAMQARISTLATAWRAAGVGQGLRVRMGIASGTCTVGDFGSSQRLDYTTVGRAVNLASRLERAAQGGQVLLAESTAMLVAPLVACRSLGPRRLKGLETPVCVYEPMTTQTERVCVRRPGLTLEVDDAVDAADLDHLLATLHALRDRQAAPAPPQPTTRPPTDGHTSPANALIDNPTAAARSPGPS